MIGARSGMLLAGAVLASLMFAAFASAGGGNSGNAKACKSGGWKTMVTANGAHFKNQGACVSYAVRGSTAPKGETPSGTEGSDDSSESSALTAPCKNGAWTTALGVNGISFRNQGACVSYVARGGSLSH
jgi:hypothetical protein